MEITAIAEPSEARSIFGLRIRNIVREPQCTARAAYHPLTWAPSVTIISLIRLVYLVRAHSFYSLGLLYEGDGARAVIWSNVEVELAIVCGMSKNAVLDSNQGDGSG